MAEQIPDGITRKLLIDAIDALNRGAKHNFSESTGYDVLYKGQRYPPKAVVGLAASVILGKELGPYDFKGGQSSRCFKVLEANQFEIITKDGKTLHSKEQGLEPKWREGGSMSFWWVNHKQTFNSEIEGGYIWSPKENSNGSKNQTYLNLQLTRPGDIVFSYASSKIQAIGIIQSPCREQPKPNEFGKAGDVWSSIGWEVPIKWVELSVPIIPKDELAKIAPLLPKKYSPLQMNGNGNQGCYLASISNELGNVLLGLAKTKDFSFISLLEEEATEIEELEVVNQVRLENIGETEKDQLITARKGQGKFRINVERIEARCRVTGVDTKNLLIASHIKPWRVSNNSERLDGQNGFLLSPHVDKLFDQGWITFMDDGDLVCSSKEIVKVLNQWGILLPLNVGNFSQEQKVYLAYHREHIYREIC